MRGEYIHALETKIKWIHWGRTRPEIKEPKAPISVLVKDTDYYKEYQAAQVYTHCMIHSDTYFMNKNFCSLVEHARQSIPDDMEFDPSWMQSPVGWIWIDTPVVVPIPAELKNNPLEAQRKKYGVNMTISAVGWMKQHDDSYFFMCYQDIASYIAEMGHPGKTGFGFGCWSHFTLKPGAKLQETILHFEHNFSATNTGTYEPGRETELQHEMRWVYSALYLMSQKMTHHSQVQTDRHTRKRAEKAKQKIDPHIHVISLRRLEEDRHRAHSGPSVPVNWQWQWEVRGHWRRQPYADGTYKNIFIEAYIKGPPERPLKDPGLKLFTAIR